ncbi:tetratricopeptide repeat-containing sulfotransferase family protein [Oleiagrimonas sp.]|jgi:Tfp pilus assembly protein PilF|uniref:tetratricopeptide repeat-containing sulfotransferase family protein n=1 Tax=Oleiagrimonas sp. TaxID=2010330 RepID=UPI002635D401|nr:tetratricopeptide repeat-containing sulfotransferase family protein [Oleiagrimonas sp.]MDA3913652.1 sulfotransferase [Oleiagrimonas sp.]
MSIASDPGRPADTLPDMARQLREAGGALGQGRPEIAMQVLARVLEHAPDHAEANRLMGIAALMGGKRDQAVGYLRAALESAPDDPAIHMTLGSALVETGAGEAGLEHLERACALAPSDAEAWCNLGVALQAVDRLPPARDAFQHTIEMQPSHAKARTKLAYVLVMLGETAAAAVQLREILRMYPDHAEAWVALGNLKTERLGPGDVRQLQSLLKRPGMPDGLRISLGFTLAKALEDQVDYAAAYAVVRDANAWKRRNLYWSREEERERVDTIARAFAEPVPGAADPALGREVIFVVHVPRPGSTLTEQILASHSQVAGGGELMVLPDLLDEESARREQAFPHWVPEATSADWQRLGEAYLKRTRHLSQAHLRFTDKTPNNWAFVGAALAMLPGARVINASRDPLETCFSCYRQLFHVGGNFTYDLDDMVAYYAGYRRLDTLWQRNFPERYFENRYEALQRDTEGQIRGLLAFCELPFEPACLDFHRTRRVVKTFSSTQVRQPLQRDTARSARYGAWLDPLRERLLAAGLLPVDAP